MERRERDRKSKEKEKIEGEEKYEDGEVGKRTKDGRERRER